MVHPTEDTVIKPLANLDGDVVSNAPITMGPFPKEGDGFFDHVIRGQANGLEILVPILTEDFDDPLVVLVPLINKGVEKTGIDKDHERCSP